MTKRLSEITKIHCIFNNFYVLEYLELNNKQIYFSLLLLTSKCTPRGTCTPGWEPLLQVALRERHCELHSLLWFEKFDVRVCYSRSVSSPNSAAHRTVDGLAIRSHLSSPGYANIRLCSEAVLAIDLNFYFCIREQFCFQPPTKRDLLDK